MVSIVVKGAYRPSNPVSKNSYPILGKHRRIYVFDRNDMSDFNHYFKDVRHLEKIDVYRVHQLFEVKDEPLMHASKKILCAGSRGFKEKRQDIEEAIASLKRMLEMMDEDELNIVTVTTNQEYELLA